jgi:signal transduction histidine kinase
MKTRYVVFIALCCCWLKVYPQERDSLLGIYAEAVASGDANAAARAAEKLATYHLARNNRDSATYYYNVAMLRYQGSQQKAAAAFQAAKINYASSPSVSLQFARAGFAIVYDVVSAERCNLANIIGIHHSMKGLYDTAVFYYLIALNTATRLADEGLINKVKGNLGELYGFKGEYAKALQYQLEVLQYHERHSDSALIIRTLVNVGNTYNYMSKHQRALQYYLMAYPALQGQNTSLAANLLNSMAVAYGDVGDHRKEKELLLASLSIKTRLGDSLGIANTCINLAQVEENAGNENAATDYYNKAMVIAESIGNEKLKQIVRQNTGIRQEKNNEKEKALATFLRVLHDAEKNKDISSERRALARLYTHYKSAGDFTNAYYYLERYQDLLDTVLSDSYVKQLTEAETRYETRKKQMENERLAYENKIRSIEKDAAERDKLWAIRISSAGFTGTLVIFFLVYRNSRIRSRAREERNLIKATFNAEQRERIRIARDLHDNVGGQLSYLISNIDWMLEHPELMHHDETKQRLSSLGTTGKQAMLTLRETIWALNHTELSVEDFADRYKQFAMKMVEFAPHIRVRFNEEIVVNRMLSPGVALNLFRICQETFNNSLRHAQCSQIDVRFASTDSCILELTITDNGIGFDVSGMAREGHYGLANMKDRATEAGAELAINSTPGQGTRVIIKKAG